MKRILAALIFALSMGTAHAQIDPKSVSKEFLVETYDHSMFCSLVGFHAGQALELIINQSMQNNVNEVVLMKEIDGRLGLREVVFSHMKLQLELNEVLQNHFGLTAADIADIVDKYSSAYDKELSTKYEGIKNILELEQALRIDSEKCSNGMKKFRATLVKAFSDPI